MHRTFGSIVIIRIGPTLDQTDDLWNGAMVLPCLRELHDSLQQSCVQLYPHSFEALLDVPRRDLIAGGAVLCYQKICHHLYIHNFLGNKVLQIQNQLSFLLFH